MAAAPPPPPVTQSCGSSGNGGVAGGSGPSDWRKGVPTAEELQRGLTELERTVQGQIAEEVGIRNCNAGFDPQNETTQLLVAACEKLMVEKESMDRANFEEHTSELPFVCRHFNTSVDSGLTERAYREKLAAAAQPVGSKPKRRRRVFALCCQLEFPPQQSWWIDITRCLGTHIQVLRAGKLVLATPQELVQGDVMYLQAGQRAAADGRVLVHAEGTAIDVSDLEGPAEDLRVCSVEASAMPITASSNIVLKDSYLVRGSLFCMVVRSPMDPFIPMSAPISSSLEEHEFRVDMAVPPGMSAKQCRNLFKALCVKAHMPCRSFFTICQLANVRALVVLLNQDLLDSGTVPQLSATTRRLKKRLFLVDCGCRLESLEALAKELECNVISFTADEQESCSGGEGTLNVDACSPLNSARLNVEKGISTAEMDRIQNLVQSKDVTVAILSGVVEDGLAYLCSMLFDMGTSPLYAMGTFAFPRCFKQFTSSAGRAMSQMSMDSFSPLPYQAPKASIRPLPADSEPNGAQSIIPPPTSASKSDGREREVSRLSSDARSSTRASERSSVQEDAIRAMTSTPSRYSSPSIPLEGGLDLSGISHPERKPGAKLIELLVSINSIGIVSEYAQSILLKSDLACLAQALEITSKGVPEDTSTQPT